MPPPPPRPAASRQGAPASGGSNQGGSNNPVSSSGPRAKEGKEQAPGTFFLGRYRVVDEIGVGGMASVHLARMDGPGGFQKWVAIKRIHPHLVEDDQFVDMFLDEARIAAGINHANVAQVFDLGKDDNTYWIAMEYLHGEPLREVMRRAEDRGQRISPELAARICADAAEGLHAAHELRGKNGQLLGLVHRDVTPHNLFLTYDGYTKVVDFGIAKVADRLSSTRAGTLKGKLAYMSPEQVRGAEVDRTTDIFALGVVLWEITTNQRLFRMDTDLDTLEKVQACIVPPPSTIVPGYPPELEAVLMKALSKRKQDRFATARDFSRALQQFLARSGQFVGPEEVAQFLRTVFAERIQKREAHLAWASEVTGAVNIEQLRKKPSTSDDTPSHDSAAKPPAPPPRAPPPQHAPASGERPRPPPPPSPAVAAAIASQSLMDDDEDVPTTVAMREDLQLPTRPGAVRPAAGFPAPVAAPPAAARNAGNAGMGGQPAPSPASYAASSASYAANVNRPSATPAPQGYSYGGGSERTAAIPSPADLGSTVALPSGLALPEMGPSPTAQRPSPNFGGHQLPPNPGTIPMPSQSYGAPQSNGQGFGFQQQGGPAPTFGAPQSNPQLTPAGMVGGVPMNYPMSASPGQPGQPGGPQSQIETALSLPRPDPAALWMAQQEKHKGGERRSAGVLLAVVALTALCVIGIGALIFFKLRARSQQHITPDTAPSVSATVSAAAAPPPPTAPPAPPAPAPTASPTATATAAAATATATAAAAAPPPATANTTAAAAAGAQAQATAQSSAPKGDPGFLTIVCNPYCDDVLDQGRSLGPSPVVHLSVTPGQHRITLKKGKDSKVISVIVVAGQVTAQRVSMK